MTVENQFPYQSFTATGLQTNFTLGFYVDDKDHFEVKKNDQAVSKNNYSYNSGSNSIVFNTTPQQGDVIEVQRSTSPDRATNYATYNNSFRPEVLNKDIDRIWLKLQELGVVDYLQRVYFQDLHTQQKNQIDQNYSELTTSLNSVKAYLDFKNSELKNELNKQLKKHEIDLSLHEELLDQLWGRISLLGSSSLLGGKLYSTINDALVSTKNHEYFNLVGDKGEIFAELYQNQNGIAVPLGKKYPSLDAIELDSSFYLNDGFNINNADKLAAFLSGKSKAKIKPGSEITIEKHIVIDLTNTQATEIDLQGAILNFKDDGQLTFRGKGSPYLTTIVTTDLIRGNTKFRVASTAGIEIGDLILVKSPAIITAGITLTQTYLVQGIDTDNNLYVMGAIVGDLRSDQITAQELTGNITVECYKVAKKISLKNGEIKSFNRDGQTTSVFFDGFKQVDITEFSPDKLNRTAVNFNYCGIVNIDKCMTIDPGYVKNDQGYNSVSTAPYGLSYGYGFLASYCYCVNFFNNHILAGWHGVDVARGVTIANIYSNTFHKGAFGASSHEGQWIFNFFNNVVFGGHAVTSRSIELYIRNNTAHHVKERFIIGNASHQVLIIENNFMEASKGTICNFAYFSGAYPNSIYSNVEPVAIVKNNTVIGLTNTTLLQVAKNLEIIGNSFTFNGSGYINIVALNNTGKLFIAQNTHKGNVNQFVYHIASTFAEIELCGEKDYTSFNYANNSLITLSTEQSNFSITRCEVFQKGHLVLTQNNRTTIIKKANENTIHEGTFSTWNQSNITVEKYYRNTTKNSHPVTNQINYIDSRDNIVTSILPQSSVSKTQDWLSLAPNSVQSTTILLSGTKVGDHVVANMNISLSGTKLWAEVTATGIVTIYHQNPTTAAVDLPSGTLTVKVL